VEISRDFCLLCGQPETTDLTFKRYKISPKPGNSHGGVTESDSGGFSYGGKRGWKQSPCERLRLVAEKET